MLSELWPVLGIVSWQAPFCLFSLDFKSPPNILQVGFILPCKGLRSILGVQMGKQPLCRRACTEGLFPLQGHRAFLVSFVSISQMLLQLQPCVTLYWEVSTQTRSQHMGRTGSRAGG